MFQERQRHAAVPTITRYIIVESEAMAVTMFHRDNADELFRATGRAEDEVLSLPEIGVELPGADVYPGFSPPPPDKEA